ncbi:prepilin-type cleavage/methylation domain-containing protein, partial [bacterium]
GVDPKDRFNPASAARWRAESDGKFDPAKTPFLHHILRPYVKSGTVFHCPADIGWTTNRLSQDDTDGGLRDVHPSSYVRFGTSYYCWTGFSLGLNTAADIKNPAQEVLLFDGELWHGSKVNSSVNGLFADGHVQNLTFDQFMTASNGGD